MGKYRHITSTVILLVFLVLLTVTFSYRLAFRGLIFPRVSIAGIEVTGMDKVTATRLVKTYFQTKPNSVKIQYQGSAVGNLDSLVVERDVDWAVEQALNKARGGNYLTQISSQVNLLFKGDSIQIPVKYDKDELEGFLSQVQLNLDIDPVWPKLVSDKGEIKLMTGKNGEKVQVDELRSKIVASLSLPGDHMIEVPIQTVGTAANEERVKAAIEALDKWSDERPVLYYKSFEKKLAEEEMIGLFGLIAEPVNKEVLEKIVKEIKPKVETEPKDAVFVFEDNKVREFQPEVIGLMINVPELETKITEALFSAQTKRVELPVILSYPKIKAGDINDLGIKELIGVGKSSFSHSIPGRIFNVNLAASRIHGTLVAPGEEFSFNKAVGEISRATGYQSAYIISEGRTVLGDGGGVCQVSTTTFRAALDAGLPITERKAHAYRVGYYEQDSAPGIDATVFYPSADFKFVNDTGHYILLQYKVDTKNLTMKTEIYGTSDGRTATISKPVITNQSPPPATVYVDDPTLPAGVKKQIDWSAWGARTAFNYTVEKDGQKIYEKTFVSNYQPWRAVFLVGVGQ